MDTCSEQLTNPDPTLYNDELWRAGQGYCTYFRTAKALLFIVFSSCSSALASFLVIYIIIISPTKLSTIYHRLMFVTAISDIIYSVANAFVTLPMPAPGVDYYTDMINTQGFRMGNIQTCTAQGFFLVWGCFSEAVLYFGLGAYYLFAIGFKMTTECMLKYLEPVIYVATITSATLVALLPVFDGGYNAFFGHPTCAVIPKPWFCVSNSNGDDEGVATKCLRGDGEVNYSFERKYYTISFILYIIPFVILCWRVFYKERQTQMYLEKFITEKQGDHLLIGRNYGTAANRLLSLPGTTQIFGTNIRISELLNAEEDEDIPIQELLDAYNHQYQHAKAIALQSMLYLLSISVTCFSYFSVFYTGSEPSLTSGYNYVLLVLSNIQGVQNLCIFLFHKVYTLKRSYSYGHLSSWGAIKHIFKEGGISDAFVISGFHLLSDGPAAISTSIDDDESVLGGDEEDDAPRMDTISEKMVKVVALGFPTKIKRFSNRDVAALTNSGCDSYGCSANYGGSVVERSIDSVGSMELSYKSEDDNDKDDSVENAS